MTWKYKNKEDVDPIKLCMVQNQLTPLRSEGRGANSFLVTMWPLFKPTKRPVFGCFGAITCLKNHNPVNVRIHYSVIKPKSQNTAHAYLLC